MIFKLFVKKPIPKIINKFKCLQLLIEENDICKNILEQLFYHNFIVCLISTLHCIFFVVVYVVLKWLFK